MHGMDKTSSRMSLQRQVLDSDYRRKKKMAGRHIAIDTWLEALNMSDYFHLFHQYGGVEDLLYVSESEIKELGIKNGAHRAKIVSSLRILRDKYEKGRVTGSGLFSLQRTPSFPSSSEPNSPTAPYPDYQHVIASPEKLQLDLQRELAGDPLELRSRPWYHGNISRQRAELIVVNNGDFLVRDCISKPGDFVLTCKWKGTPLNFMINSLVGDCAPGSLPTISYQFEEDAFPTIQQLIVHYQQRGKPVTQVSGAILKTPISRSMPLSYYDTKYGALINFASGIYSTPDHSPKSSPFVTPAESPTSSPDMSRRGQRWTGSQPILNIIDSTDQTHGKRDSRPSSLDRCDSLPVINVTTPAGLVESSEPHDQHNSLRPPIVHARSGSAPALMPESTTNGTSPKKFSTLGRRKLAPASSESELSNPAPPKPSRIPSVKYKQKPTVVVRKIHVEDDDRDYSDYEQVKQQPSWLHGDVSQFEHVAYRHSPQNSSSEPQKGRKGNRVNREKLFLPAQPVDPNVQNLNISNALLSPTRGLPPNPQDLDNPPPSPTYQIVARSRSFQLSNPQSNCDNNSNQITGKGYQTLPSKSSRLKASRSRLASDNVNTERGFGDYDVPREHDNDIFGCHENSELWKMRKITKPPKTCLSAIAVETFQSSLLPKVHKALDPSVLLTVKTLLLNKTPRAIAMHVTKYDLNFFTVTCDKDLGLGVSSGLELITLPHGRQLRQDAIERWECLRLFSMVTLLTCQTVTERAKILSLWIQTCLELKIATGNLYSFTAIMSALAGSQVNRLTDTWLVLRQNHTASAYNFDTKLRPAYKSLNDGSSDLPLNNETVPYVTPVCQLLEREVEGILLDYFWEKGLDPVGSAIDVLLAHLDTARVVASQGNLYRVNGSTLMTNFSPDPDLAQLVCPEFHLLVMWGEKGCGARRRDRVDKLEQILSLLTQKIQVPGDDGTEV
ncbi:unnamed protein product [Lymnaea stagnalis]|uniref:Breast cancer anti-estrogen resistance protein 3 n=1 Tax=Lymnaea stagnalis TaxID=6523 RepID=A0AAV2IIK5_LYMST